MAWWDSEKPGTPCRVVLFQVDMAGSSRWAEQSETDLAPAKAFADFAVRLQLRLQFIGFDRLQWASDGGVFARKFNHQSDVDEVCKAAKETFECFQEWKRPEWQLKLRVAAAYIHNAIVNLEPGYWYSPRLSAFLKYERELSWPNAFVITDDLHHVMDPDSVYYDHFSIRKQVELPTKDLITIWIDARLSEDPESFCNAALRRDEESPSSLRTRLLKEIDVFRATRKREEHYDDLL